LYFTCFLPGGRSVPIGAMLPTREDGRKLPGWLSFALPGIGLPALQAPLLLLMLAAPAR
jgi:hypothetical protein